MPSHSSKFRLIDIMHKFQHVDGNMYTTPVLQNGDTADDTLKSKLILFEDGLPLRQRHEHHSTIIRVGRGAYSHWERHILFSTSDNTDPNKNQRLYSYAVDHMHTVEVERDGIAYLRPPFIFKKGFCWTVAVLPYGDDVTTGDVSRLTLFEDGNPLTPSHTSHNEIVINGKGSYSHWQNHLFFSTSEGSDPNTNSRLYTYKIGDPS